MREASSSAPVPRERSDDPESLVRALKASRDAHAPREEVDPRLLRITAEADATGFRPWEEEAAPSDAGTLPFRRRWLSQHRWWWIAAAACLPLFVGVRFWRASSSDVTKLSRFEPFFDLRVGYGDFASVERGHTTLHPGTTAKVVFTLVDSGYYSLLLLDRNMSLTCEVQSEAAIAGRHEVEWRPGDTDREAYETVFVVVGKKAWPVAERFARDFSGNVYKTREEAVQTVVGEIHARFHLAVAAVTYVVRSSS